jgi:MFS family permease
MVLSGMAASPYNMYAILYAKSPVINMDMALYGKVLTICYGISFCLSFFLGTLADRFHPLRMSIAALLTYLATMIAGWFWVKDEFSFEVIMYLHTVLSGCYFTLSASLGQRLFPHLLFAQFNSAYSMIHAITTVLVSMLFGWLLLKLNSDYRYCFLFGTVMTGLGIACLVKIYFDFLKLGGDKAYQAPDPGE